MGFLDFGMIKGGNKLLCNFYRLFAEEIIFCFISVGRKSDF